MAGKILFLVAVAAASLAAQETEQKDVETPRTDVTVTPVAPRKCSIPLVNLRPSHTARIPLLRPRNDSVSKRFFIEPPAPPCDEKRDPLVSKAVPTEKEQPQAK